MAWTVALTIAGPFALIALARFVAKIRAASIRYGGRR